MNREEITKSELDIVTAENVLTNITRNSRIDERTNEGLTIGLEAGVAVLLAR